jgi:hypothetical protein
MTWYQNGARQAYMGWGTPGTVFELATENSNALSLNTGGASRMWIASGGNVGIGTASPAGALHVYSGAWPGIISNNPGGWATIAMKGNYNSSMIMHYGDAGGSNELRFGRYAANMTSWQSNVVRIDMDAPDTSFYLGGDGWVTITRGLTVTSDIYANNFYHNSDRRLKDNIKPARGLELVTKMQGVTFNWKKDGTKSAGVIAQDIEKIMPEAVTTDEKGMKSVSYDTLIAPIIESIKELKADNDHLKADNDNLRVLRDADAKAIADVRSEFQTLILTLKASRR